MTKKQRKEDKRYKMIFLFLNRSLLKLISLFKFYHFSKFDFIF